MPENVGLEVRQLPGIVLFGCRVRVRNRLSMLILGRVFVEVAFPRRGRKYPTTLGLPCRSVWLECRRGRFVMLGSSFKSAAWFAFLGSWVAHMSTLFVTRRQSSLG